MTDLASTVEGIGALAEPVRRALYAFVAASPAPVGREEAAAAVGVPVHTAKFHLDRLAGDGLLDVEFQRRSGRTGPGAGRPAKLYRRSTQEFVVSLPPRHYDLVGRILADAVEQSAGGTPLDESLRSAAERAAYRVVESVPATEADRLRQVLAGVGYEPRDEEAGLRLVNCPFHSIAQQHTALVCGVNRDFVQGVLDALGRADVQACLTPTPGQCCVTVLPATAVGARA
jgi:predicted ArsR family transcriptional regulator